jgi:hypothetical protein
MRRITVKKLFRMPRKAKKVFIGERGRQHYRNSLELAVRRQELDLLISKKNEAQLYAAARGSKADAARNAVLIPMLRQIKPDKILNKARAEWYSIHARQTVNLEWLTAIGQQIDNILTQTRQAPEFIVIKGPEIPLHMRMEMRADLPLITPPPIRFDI